MISPRATRLVRVRDSRGVRTALIELLSSGDPLRVRDCLVVLPTRAAASHLRGALGITICPPEPPCSCRTW